ncbi:hypothetical protein LL912_02305 [Niabella sp. CC-SYL272]|uniref:hypothetical protein n=1 Tax=Niabella agricola TaxID=2891571 RepID=UPI001F3B297D|nr:hypothetical protein [Niabella agricola]MCF3107602.1 hypothetical protein [Niabella agricola]
MKTTAKQKQTTGTAKKTNPGKKRKPGGNPDGQTFSDDPTVIDQALKDQSENKTQRTNRSASKK